MTQSSFDPSLPPGDPRPVVVVAEKGIRIEQEQRALALASDDGVTRHIPLRHIATLVLPVRTEIEFAAIVACARHRIPVIVRDTDGKVVMRIISGESKTDSLRRQLARLTSDYHWPDRFSDWRKAQRARIAAIHRRRQDLSGPLSPRALEKAFVQEMTRHVGKQTTQAAWQHFHGLALREAEQILLTCGLDARDGAWRDDRIDLADELARLLTFQLADRLLIWSIRQQRRANQERLASAIARLFEAHRRRIDNSLRDLVNRLDRWLVGTEGRNP